MKLENKMLKMYINITSEIKGLNGENQREEDFEECVKIQNEINKREYFLIRVRELLKSVNEN